MQWLDAKYVNLMGHRLRNFKRKGNNKWNFSCPFCGDSKTNKYKARGYVYERKGKLRYACHNCSVPGIDVPKLIKQVDPFLHDEYVREKIMEMAGERQKSDAEIFADKMKTPKFVATSPLRKLKKISVFRPDSFVKMFVDARKLPPESHYRLFYTKAFKQFVNDECIPDKFDKESLERGDEPRLIIPFIDPDGNVFGLQGRSFKPDSPVRYITIMMDPDKPKLFGWDQVDVRLPHIYVVEGPLDSLFLPNCIASAGSDLTTNLSAIGADMSQFIIVYDNEPRNKDIVSKVDMAISQGFHVCIWPDSMKEKDINDMVLAGYDPKKIVDIIHENVYSGLQAKLRFQQWKKV